jgi:hypothetical protein
VIVGGSINGAEYPVGHIGWTWDLEKVTSGEAGGVFAVHGSRFAVSDGLFVGRVGLQEWLGWDLWD